MQRPNVRFKSKADLKRQLPSGDPTRLRAPPGFRAIHASPNSLTASNLPAQSRKNPGRHVAVKGTKRRVAFAARRNALRLLRPTS